MCVSVAGILESRPSRDGPLEWRVRSGARRERDKCAAATSGQATASGAREHERCSVDGRAGHLLWRGVQGQVATSGQASSRGAGLRTDRVSRCVHGGRGYLEMGE